MKVINDGIPEAIYNAILNDNYTKGDADISVTELLNPPQIRVLKRKHDDKIVENASDRIWSLLGQAVHTILERANNSGIAERRLNMQVNGWKLSGGMDAYYPEQVLLQDYKITTVYKVIDFKNKTQKPAPSEEWVKQLNIYAEMLRQNGDRVATLQVVAIFRDWSSGELERASMRGEYYPPKQSMIIDIPLIPSEEVQQYILSQIKLHQAATEGILPPCTKEERWAKDDTFAIMKAGNKRATQVLATEEGAKLALANLGGKGYNIVYREGQSIRCERYCPVKDFCPQYAAMNAAKKVVNE